MRNPLAINTLRYIWTHPNSQTHRWRSLYKFINWQIHKRIFTQPWRYGLLPNCDILCHRDSHAAAAAIYCGLYDYDEMNFLLRYLRSQDTFLDVGANIGIYTLLAASKIKSGTVHSFEALPRNYRRLLENVRLNHFTQVQTYPLAVSDRGGTVQLDCADGDSMPFLIQDAKRSGVAVESSTLDQQLLQIVDENLTLGKMDIEGAEILALRGAVQLMQQQKPKVWILEITDAIHRFGSTKQALVELLSDFGYGLYRYRAQHNELSPLTLREQSGNNVLAIAESELEFVYQRLSDVA